ncbi:hypothetical protein N665_0858s0020 [Sinapis alba]|nr:hypothetical protein N665_0858s0020 [Sinapis alba]
MQSDITPITIPDIPENVYEYLGSLPKEICRILLPVLHHRPDSEVYAFRTETGAFAAWVQKEVFFFLSKKKNTKLMLDHLCWIAWAVIAAKLLSIARCVTDMGPFVDLSGQYLLDVVTVHKSMKLKRNLPCCNLNTVAAGIKYALEHGIPNDQDWKFKGCENTLIPKDVHCLNVMGSVASLTLEQALVYLQKQPVAAKFHQFANFDNHIDVYRGPTSEDDEYVGTEDVMIYETKLVGEEWVAVVVIPSADSAAYVNVSLDVMVIYTSGDDVDNNDFDLDVDNIERRTLATPGRLLTEFVAVGPRED